MIQTHYFDKILEPTKLVKTVNKICNFISKNVDVNNNMVIGKGFSGLLVIPTISYNLRIPMAFLRGKEKDHSDFGLEGNFGSPFYIIIDDIAYTGETIKVITDTIKVDIENPPKLNGIIFYEQTEKDIKQSLRSEYKCWVKEIK